MDSRPTSKARLEAAAGDGWTWQTETETEADGTVTGRFVRVPRTQSATSRLFEAVRVTYLPGVAGVDRFGRAAYLVTTPEREDAGEPPTHEQKLSLGGALTTLRRR